MPKSNPYSIGETIQILPTAKGSLVPLRGKLGRVVGAGNFSLQASIDGSNIHLFPDEVRRAMFEPQVLDNVRVSKDVSNYAGDVGQVVEVLNNGRHKLLAVAFPDGRTADFIPAELERVSPQQRLVEILTGLVELDEYYLDELETALSLAKSLSV